MKTYIITGINWNREIKIDETLFDTHLDACIEAATRILENSSNFPEDEDLTNILIVNEKNKQNHVMLSTAAVLRNAGKYAAAEVFEQ